MGRILAIDYGLKRTGIAVSDPLRIIAGGLDTVPTAQLRQWLDRYMTAESVDIVVVGMPRRMDGSESDSYSAIAPFVEGLRRDYPDKQIVMYDERFTSVLAHRAMIDGGMKKMQRRDKAVVDKISATIILQSFMESREYAQMQGGASM
ncbi:MAG: Holliday junction resolvase RuvX [Tidjanibacter sp.]|nr:Holliday junction resolvase RuvX [Tidjanibacter sp.]MBR6831719.1 Holliday junction resolvase RuvX [Tidjanibacter sp.]